MIFLALVFNRIAVIRSMIMVFVILQVACNKKKSPIDEEELKPQKTTLIYPNLNEACLSGKVISLTKSEINFSWAKAQNVESYEVNIKNLLSGEVINKHTAGLNLGVTLERNTPYSWFVISRKGTDFIKSDTWKFYNSGVSMFYYAPFPADLLSPTVNQVLPATNGKITLIWEGADVDNDISNFDVYFGANSNPPSYKTNITDKKLIDIDVTSATTYYWKIVTKDLRGNTSDSGICRFSVN